MGKTAYMPILMVGAASSSIKEKFLGQTKVANTCFLGINNMDDQEATIGTSYGTLTTQWLDTLFDISNQSSNAYVRASENSSIGAVPSRSLGKRRSEIDAIITAGEYYYAEIEGYTTTTLWGDNRSYEDIKQGSIGDCYFLAACALAA